LPLSLPANCRRGRPLEVDGSYAGGELVVGNESR
jgi:hypothetical protein